MGVDELDHLVEGRSSSAARKADALRKIAFARRSSRFSRSSSASRCASDVIDYLRDFANSRRMHRTRGPLYAVPGSDWGQSGDTTDVLSFGSPDPDQPGRS